jgi:hypothetical protein
MIEIGLDIYPVMERLINLIFQVGPDLFDTSAIRKREKRNLIHLLTEIISLSIKHSISISEEV